MGLFPCAKAWAAGGPPRYVRRDRGVCLAVSSTAQLRNVVCLTRRQSVLPRWSKERFDVSVIGAGTGGL